LRTEASGRCGGTAQTPTDVINQTFRMSGDHRFAWDFQALSPVLVNMEFRNVTRLNSEASFCPQLCLEARARSLRRYVWNVVSER
jgi:hypothetical protein